MPLGLILGLGSLLLGANQASQQQRALQAQQQAEERRRREAEQRYQQTYDQLAGMLSGILDPSYSAIPQSMIDQMVGRVGQDIAVQQRGADERALRDYARRGLAGSSLVDQRQSAIGRTAQQALADSRMRAEQAALEQTHGLQSQARGLLGNLAGMSAGMSQAQAQAARDAGTQLLGQQQQLGSTFNQLAGTLLSPYIANLFPQQTWGGFAMPTFPGQDPKLPKVSW